jgi:hypothetical protein
MTYEKVKLKFDYFDNSFKPHDGIPFYRTHGSNVKTFMNKLLKNDSKEYKYANYEDVTIEEYIWFTKCDNGGLTYLNQKGKYTDTYGYDYEMSYLADMVSIGFHMPTKQGKCNTIHKLNQTIYLTYGIYRVKIECDDYRLINKKILYTLFH